MNKLTAGLGGYRIKSKDLAEKEGLVGIAKYRDLRRRIRGTTAFGSSPMELGEGRHPHPSWEN